MTGSAILRTARRSGHHGSMEDTEATQLMLEAVFDIRAAVYEIRDAVVWRDEEDDGEEETEEDS